WLFNSSDLLKLSSMDRHFFFILSTLVALASCCAPHSPKGGPSSGGPGGPSGPGGPPATPAPQGCPALTKWPIADCKASGAIPADMPSECEDATINADSATCAQYTLFLLHGTETMDCASLKCVGVEWVCEPTPGSGKTELKLAQGFPVSCA
ncbi:hypothetical protein PFISCL1PPCAC_13066, partial [Pristionchus fissidentatus]